MMYKRKNYDNDIPFRIHYAAESTKTVCLACIISCILVLIPFFLFYKGEHSQVTVLVICLLICCLTMLITIHMLIRKAKVFVEPIEKLEEAVSKVKNGDFEVKVELSDNGKSINELNKLIEDFNNMAKSLKDMEYMNKDFINNVSHELKTPISSIAGFTEILMDSSLSEEERQEYLSLVNSESLRLSRLCENMLSISRLDKQRIVNKHKLVNVTEQIRKTIIMLSEKWRDKGHEFNLNLDEIEINSDEDLLQQIWVNLIDNAMKYSSDGTTLYISGKDNGSYVEIIIRDEGIGIPEDKIEHIFRRFYQCEESHKNQGNGLGLSIVKKIIELLGGSIECKSKEGEGTEMIVNLYK
ncbi:MAG: HAMP domain-containing histidine kinase [Clostridium sp.]|nr:HAMP domain-containing histidine kinase [Clostridium sp.]